MEIICWIVCSENITICNIKIRADRKTLIYWMLNQLVSAATSACKAFFLTLYRLCDNKLWCFTFYFHFTYCETFLEKGGWVEEVNIVCEILCWYSYLFLVLLIFNWTGKECLNFIRLTILNIFWCTVQCTLKYEGNNMESLSFRSVNLLNCGILITRKN
jgi:hypothetical protein